MRGKCLQHTSEKKEKNTYIYWIYKLEVQGGKKWKKYIYIKSIKIKSILFCEN